MNYFIDTHCHLNFADFSGDLPQVLDEARGQGVTSLIVPATHSESFAAILQLVDRHSELKAAFGVHPWYLAAEPALESEEYFRAVLTPYIESHHAVAIGECGLDALIDIPLALQQTFLRWHLSLAYERQLPLILHSRKTHALLHHQLKSYKGGLKGVVHGFSGSYEEALAFIKLGFFIGVGGVITYPRAAKTRATIARLPLEYLVLETDAPHAPLLGQQGKRNVPSNIPAITSVLAELKALTIERVAEVTTQNARRIFAGV